MTISSDALRQLTLLAQRMRDSEKKLEALEQQTKQEKEILRGIAEEEIPGLMSELELESIKLESGETITIAEDVFAAIPVEQRETAFNWLEEHEFGGLIKTNVGVAYGKGELEKATALLLKLQQEGLDAALKREVHPQTLRAWLREQLEKGNDVPMEMFGARPVKQAKIKAPKVKA